MLPNYMHFTMEGRGSGSAWDIFDRLQQADEIRKLEKNTLELWRAFARYELHKTEQARQEKLNALSEAEALREEVISLRAERAARLEQERRQYSAGRWRPDYYA